MLDFGSVLGFFTFIVLPAVFFVSYRIWRNQVTAENKAKEASAAAAVAQRMRRARALKATELLGSFSQAPAPAESLRQLHKLLKAEPMGFLPELTQQPEIWFEQAAPGLRSMALTGGAAAEIVALYFECFSFPSSQQSAVMNWLNQLLAAITDPAHEQLFNRIADSVLAFSEIAEADWLYRRALEQVRATAGAPPFKAIALRIGRIRYGAARPDRRPTLYDEQAIANDIGMSI
ncbi:MAG: hypothetical protein ABI779_09160 [Acidobacteriota bacterium]